jgi:hypothetical protein
MGSFETKIADVIRSLASSLQLSMLLPATFLVWGLIWLLEPSGLNLSNGLLSLFIGLSVITVSYLLHALNMPIIRGFEGYMLPDSPPVRALRACQLYKFYRHHHLIYKYQQKINCIKALENKWQFHWELSPERDRQLERWRRGWLDLISHQRERLEERYPPTPDRVLATGLGNAIAAFELYPERRYHIDIAHLWPRFVPILVEKKYASFIEGEKAILDFLVNLLLVSGIIWIVAAGVFARTGRVSVGMLFFSLPLSAYLIYKGSCVAATNWGTTVKSAFDLYRFELKKILNLRIPEGAELPEERTMWKGISEFLAYGRLDNFDGFDYASMYVKDRDSQEEWEK